MLCTAVIFSTRSPEPSVTKRAAQSRTGKNENEMEAFFPAFHPPGSPPNSDPPSGRLFSDWRVEHVSLYSLQIAPRSKDSSDESFSLSGCMCIHVHVPSDLSLIPPHSFCFLSSHASTRRGDFLSCVSGPRCVPRGELDLLNMNSPYGTLICIWITLVYDEHPLSLPTKSTARISRVKTPPQREFQPHLSPLS